MPLIGRGGSCPLNFGGHVDTLGGTQRVWRSRRRHSAEFKAEVVQACRQPGVSIAAVSLSYGLNANLGPRWMAEPRPDALTAPREKPAINVETPPLAPNQFLPVRLADGAPPPEIHLEPRRGPTTGIVHSPL